MNSELSLIRYNLRCKLYHAAAEEATKCLKNKGGNKSSSNSSKTRGILLYWRACAIGLSGRYRDALNDLQGMRKNHRYLDYAILSALIWFHQKVQMTAIEENFDNELMYNENGNDDDGDEVEKLTMALKAAKDCCVHMDEGALLASEFHFYVGEYNEAQSCLNVTRGGSGSRMQFGSGDSVMLSSSSMHSGIFQQEINRMTIWLETALITTRRKTRGRISNSTVDQIISCLKSSKDFDCCMGRVRYYTDRGDTVAALHVLNEIIVSDDTFFPAYVERAKIQLHSMNFRLAFKSAQLGYKYSSVDSNSTCNNSYGRSVHLEALRIFTLTQYLCSDGKDDCENERRLANLGQIVSSLEGEEHPPILLYDTSKLFSHVCNCDTRVLELCLRLMGKACRVADGAVMASDHHHTFQLEYARQLRCLCRYQEAMERYHLASELDQSETDALQGLIVCQILVGDIDDAREQMEFLSLMEDEGTSNDIDLLYSKILLNEEVLLGHEGEVGEGEDPFPQMINTALDIFSDNQHRQTLGLYASFDVRFFIEIIRRFVRAFDFDTVSPHSDQLVDKVLSLLGCIIERYPYLDEAYILYSKIKADQNQVSSAEHVIQKCLVRCSKSTEALIYRAQLYVRQGNKPDAQQSLAEALSQDFGIQNDPNYCLVKGILYAENGQHNDARDTLEKVIRHVEDPNDKSVLMSRLDIISAFSSMGTVLKSIGQDGEVAELLALAEKALGGSKTFRLLSLKSDLYIKSGELVKALKLYDGFSKDSPRFEAAQLAKASIYLKNHNTEKYIQCYRNILMVDATPQSYLALGDALMIVNSPMDAFEAYNLALEIAPCEKLAIKIGKTMVACHEFTRAVEHLKLYVREFPTSFQLRLNLSTLYIDLEKYEDALEVMNPISDTDPDDTKYPVSDTSPNTEERLIILKNAARIHRCMGNFRDAIECLKTILEELQRSQTPSNRTKNEREKHDILLELSECLVSNDQLHLGIETSKEAASIAKRDNTALYMLIGQLFKDAQLELCEKYCKKLLSIDPFDEQALLVSSDIMLKRSKITEAISILETNLSSYEVCLNLLPLYFKAGRRKDAVKLYDSLSERATKCNDKMDELGNWVCQGLYQRLNSKPALALNSFHRVRKYGSSKWFLIACLHMVEMYLRIDDFDYWCNQSNVAEIPDEIMRSVMTLFKELKKKFPHSLKLRVLRGYFEIIKSIETKNFEKPIKHFSAILKLDKESVPSLLGLVLVYRFDSSQSKLRNTLKRIAKLDYDPQYSNEFLRSWLLLSLSYIERGKFDLAHDFCKRCLFYDRSCSRAWEILGRTFSCQENLADAIASYHHCVKINGPGHPDTCFKLANHYINKEEPMAAMRVMSTALEGNPHFLEMKISDMILNQCVDRVKS